jgi:demethoxyubiquinone hydroxylase (CLK1/Coq7/Cat5 family)
MTKATNREKHLQDIINKLQKENKELKDQLRHMTADRFTKSQTGYRDSESPDETTTLHMDL